MTEVNEKFKELKSISDLGEQASILYLLNARIAAGLENKEQSSEQILKTVGEVWNEAASHFEIVAEKNPEQAFKLALQLSTLPHDVSQNQEKIFQWMRGDGPVLLAKDVLRKPLLNYLKTDKLANELVSKLQDYMKYDMSDIDKKTIFYEPNCFLAVATMYLGTKLENVQDNKLASSLFKTAKEKLADDQVSRVVQYYSEFEETSWMSKEVEPFLTK